MGTITKAATMATGIGRWAIVLTVLVTLAPIAVVGGQAWTPGNGSSPGAADRPATQTPAASVGVDGTTNGSIAGFVVENTAGPTNRSTFGYPPVGGATVTLVELDRTVRTDIYGFYELTEVPSGIYTVSISRGGYRTVRKEVTIERGTASRVDAYLNRTASRHYVGFSVRGLHTGLTLENATVALGGRSKQADATGNVVFDRLPARTYSVSVQADGYENWNGTVAVGPRSKTVSVRMHPSQKYTINVTATGREQALGADEDALARGTVSLRGVHDGRVVVEKETAPISENGTATFPQMPPLPDGGLYLVNVSAFGYEPYGATIGNVPPAPPDPHRSHAAALTIDESRVSVTVRHPQYIGGDGEVVTGIGPHPPTVRPVGTLDVVLNGTGEGTEDIRVRRSGTEFETVLPGRYEVSLINHPEEPFYVPFFGQNVTRTAGVRLESQTITVPEGGQTTLALNVTAPKRVLNVTVLAMNVTRRTVLGDSAVAQLRQEVNWRPVPGATVRFDPPNPPETDETSVLADVTNGVIEGGQQRYVRQSPAPRWVVAPPRLRLPHQTTGDGTLVMELYSGLYDVGADDTNDIEIRKPGYATDQVSYLDDTGPGTRTIGLHANRSWVHGDVRAVLQEKTPDADTEERDAEPRIGLRNVSVRLQTPNGSAVATTRTNPDGSFDFGFVEWGHYELAVEDVRVDFDASHRTNWTVGVEPEYGRLPEKEFTGPGERARDVLADNVDDREIEDRTPGDEVVVDLNLTQANDHGWRHNLDYDVDLEYTGDLGSIVVKRYEWRCDTTEADCPEDGETTTQPVVDEQAVIYQQTPHFGFTTVGQGAPIFPGTYRVVPGLHPTTTVTPEPGADVVVGASDPRFDPRIEDPDDDVDGDGEPEDVDGDGESEDAGIVNAGGVDLEKFDDAGNGTVEFYVTDDRTGEPLAGIDVTLSVAETGRTVSQDRTGPVGLARFEAIPDGDYEVDIRHPDARYVAESADVSVEKDLVVRESVALRTAGARLDVEARNATTGAGLAGVTVRTLGNAFETTDDGSIPFGPLGVVAGSSRTVLAHKRGHYVADTGRFVGHETVEIARSNRTRQYNATVRFEPISRPTILDATLIRGTSTDQHGLYLQGVNVTQILALEIDHDEPLEDPPTNVTLYARRRGGDRRTVSASVDVIEDVGSDPPRWATDNNDDGIDPETDYLVGIRFDVGQFPPGRNNLSLSLDTRHGAPPIRGRNLTVDGTRARVDVLGTPAWLSSELRQTGPQPTGVDALDDLTVPVTVDLSGEYVAHGDYVDGLEGGYGYASGDKFADGITYVVRTQQEYSVAMDHPEFLLRAIGVGTIGHDKATLPARIELSSEERRIEIRRSPEGDERAYEEDHLGTLVSGVISDGIGSLVGEVLQISPTVSSEGTVNTVGTARFGGPRADRDHTHDLPREHGAQVLSHDHRFRRTFDFAEVYNQSTEVSVSYPFPVGEYLTLTPEPATSVIGLVIELVERTDLAKISMKAGYRRQGRDVYRYTETYPSSVGWLDADDDQQIPSDSDKLMLSDQVFLGGRGSAAWDTVYLEIDGGVGMDYGRELRLDPPYVEGYGGPSLILSARGGAPGMGSFNDRVSIPLSYAAREGSETDVRIDPQRATAYTLPAAAVENLSTAEYSRFVGAGSTDTLVSRAFPEADPAVAVAGGEPAVAYLRERPATVRPDATVEVTARTAGEWRRPETIARNASRLALGASEETAVAVWRNTTALGDRFRGLDLHETELWYATRDPGAGSGWSEPDRLTANGVLESRPVVSVDDGQVMVAWRATPSGHPLDFDGQRVRYALLGETTEPTPTSVVEDTTVIGRPALDYRDGIAVLAYLSDADGNASTSTDRQLAVSRFDGWAWTEPAVVATGSVGEIDVALTGTDTRIAWTEGSDLRAGVVDFEGGATLERTETVDTALGVRVPSFLRDGDAIAYQAGTGKSLGTPFLTLREDGGYGEPTRLTPAGTYYENVEAAATRDGEVVLAGLTTTNATDAVPDIGVQSVPGALNGSEFDPPGNDPPVARDVRVSTTVNTSVSGSFDATDPEDDSLAYAVASSPVHGTVAINDDGFTYVPAAGYSGSDSFSYAVSDGDGGTDTATVAVTVTLSGDGFEVGRYDTDGDGIEIGELGTAAADYVTGSITIAQLGEVAAAYVTA